VNQTNRYLLAIESAIAGGSIALFNDNFLISSRCGDGAVSRAEDLLPSIIAMLAESGIAKNDLTRVAVSLGPGSYTGLRIGIATAMGLRRGLDIDYVGIPLFRAIAAEVAGAIVAVPMGKADVCFAMSEAPDEPSVLSLSAFAELLESQRQKPVFVHAALEDKIREVVESDLSLLNQNLAEYIGRAAMGLPASKVLEPIYIQNPRFG
jgi:tRNA threonylcarbamoyl adenosine modification protein YeaZ